MTLASAGGDATVRIWQPLVGRQVRIIRHPAAVFALAWNGKGSLLVTAGKDGILRTMDGDSDQVLAEQTIAPAWITAALWPRGGDELVLATSVGLRRATLPRRD